jgi:hypothetical protein
MERARISNESAAAGEREPIACTLDSVGIATRLDEFADLFRRKLIGRETTDRGIRFRFAADPEAEGEIRDLARREQTCCSFFRFDITVNGDEIWWDATVDDPEARPLLDDLLALPERLTPSVTVPLTATRRAPR